MVLALALVMSGAFLIITGFGGNSIVGEIKSVFTSG